MLSDKLRGAARPVSTGPRKPFTSWLISAILITWLIVGVLTVVQKCQDIRITSEAMRTDTLYGPPPKEDRGI